eukprot:1880818-Rhodomonas_salina.1
MLAKRLPSPGTNPAITLRLPYAMSGTDLALLQCGTDLAYGLGGLSRESPARTPGSRVTPLSAYARTTRCPVLT